jgi:hypothetical protein
MGKRDFRWREPKKPKKGAKRAKIVSELMPPAEVEVVKKRKREPSEEEESQ